MFWQQTLVEDHSNYCRTCPWKVKIRYLFRDERKKRKKASKKGKLKEIYRNARWVIFAKEGGIAPERLLLFSLLITIQKAHQQTELVRQSHSKFQGHCKLTCTASFWGKIGKLEFLHWRNYSKDRADEASIAFQAPTESVPICCYPVEVCKDNLNLTIIHTTSKLNLMTSREYLHCLEIC